MNASFVETEEVLPVIQIVLSLCSMCPLWLRDLDVELLGMRSEIEF